MPKVVLAGGSGFIGEALAKFLAMRGLEVIILSRKPATTKYRTVLWDGKTLGDWAEELEGALALVNLVGRSVDCVKTPENIDEILRSRVDSTRVLGQALALTIIRPVVWVQMSTAHLYGDSVTSTCTEDAAYGYGLAPFVAQAWEEAMLTSLPPRVREVRLRTSFVLGASGGPLQTLVGLTKKGLGGTIGSGKQGISWIHLYDLCELIQQAIHNRNMQGAYIASAPHPVSQKEFMKTLRQVLRVKVGIPTPAWLVRLGAKWFFKTDPELALYGRYVVSKRLKDEGFTFVYPQLTKALEHIAGKK